MIADSSPETSYQQREAHVLDLNVALDMQRFAQYRVSMGSFLQKHLFSHTLAQDVVMVIDEALTNVARHSYGSSDRDFAQLLITIEAEETHCFSTLTIVLKDRGPRGRSFSPARWLAENRARHAAGAPAGFGVLLLHTIMDSVEYEATDRGENRLVLKKWFCNAPAKLLFVRQLVAEITANGSLPNVADERIAQLWQEQSSMEPGDMVLALGTALGHDKQTLRQAIAQARFTLSRRGCPDRIGAGTPRS